MARKSSPSDIFATVITIIFLFIIILIKGVFEIIAFFIKGIVLLFELIFSKNKPRKEATVIRKTKKLEDLKKLSFYDYEEDSGEDKDKKLEDYALDGWQKDLVKKGEYEPWNFEEEEMEEEDFHYEDD